MTVHHVRRHTLRSIRARACAAHLNPVAQSYAFLFSLPLVVGFRVTDRVFRRASSSYVKVPVRVNAAFVKILKFEAFLLNFVSFPAGTSVITLLEKGEAALPV